MIQNTKKAVLFVKIDILGGQNKKQRSCYSHEILKKKKKSMFASHIA